MKNFTLSAAIVLLAIIAVLTGCKKDSNTTPDSGRTPFIGKWLVKPTIKNTYEVTISADPNSPNGVFISNFWQIGLSYPSASAEIKGTSIILDANQLIGDGLTVTGSGILSGTKITWNYLISTGADTTHVAET